MADLTFPNLTNIPARVSQSQIYVSLGSRFYDNNCSRTWCPNKNVRSYNQRDKFSPPAPVHPLFYAIQVTCHLPLCFVVPLLLVRILSLVRSFLN